MLVGMSHMVPIRVSRLNEMKSEVGVNRLDDNH